MTKELPEQIFLLEEGRTFSQSLIWHIQRQYFTEMGFEAWRQGEVPHYVTSNPFIARGYARLVFAFYKDQEELSGNKQTAEPLYILELGAGSGRFAFYFLTYLQELCEQENIPVECFKYVLTDFTQSNINFWREHPRFMAFFNSGMLDIAIYDVTKTEDIHLQTSGEILSTGKLLRPAVVIANYLFDGIPNDLFLIDKKQVKECLISLQIHQNPEELDARELVEALVYRYDYRECSEPVYTEPEFAGCLELYRERLADDSHVLFPAAGLRCINRLKSLSAKGVLVISADKGTHNLGALQENEAPRLVKHGSFSLSVNFHAFKYCCEKSGGTALFPDRVHKSLNINCMFWMPGADRFRLTQQSYRANIAGFGPDDFYTIMSHIRKNADGLSAKEILAYLKLAAHDSHQLSLFLIRLTELAPDLSHADMVDLVIAIDLCWRNYFPLGERNDLANRIAAFFYEAGEYHLSLFYYRESTEIYGKDTGTLFNMAACCHNLGESEEAKQLLQLVLKHDPENAPARSLLEEYKN